ncbi:MAG: HdeD family acid-resistance protein [Gaiellaceae bacterium]
MSFSLPAAGALVERTTRYWWLVLLTGVAWIVVAAIIFRFDYASVTAIAVLFGFVAIAVGVSELFVAMMAQGWWRILAALLGGFFIVVGIVAFFTPGDTFVGLAAVISFYFVFSGSWNLVTALWTRSVNTAWWVQALSGLVELGLGFWAAGYWDRSATLLVAFVGAMALLRGINEIVLAFRLHDMHSRVAVAARPA